MSRMAGTPPSPVAGEMTDSSVTLSIKPFISFRNKFPLNDDEEEATGDSSNDDEGYQGDINKTDEGRQKREKFVRSFFSESLGSIEADDNF